MKIKKTKILDENRDRFIDEVGREPNKDEESTLKKRSALETNLKATMEANRTLIASLESAYDTFFTEIANGADNMAESFKKMTISVLADLAKIYTKAFIINSLTGMTGLFGGTSSPAVTSSPSATVPFANGGIRQGGFGLTPGVYPARSPIAVFGEGNKNEAAVPLPNGKEIPVDLRGSGGVSQSNNVNVNINIDGKGGASSSVSGDNMDKLGEMLSAAVIKELLEQQRPGGILSKHGA